jgi:hypothetical protein
VKTWLLSCPRSSNTWVRYIIEFLNNFINFKNDSVHIYDRLNMSYPRPGSMTKGKKALVHSKNIPLDVKKEIDKKIKINYKSISYYLKRYFESGE